METGVVYVVTGRTKQEITSSILEVIRSSKLLRYFSPSLQQTVVVNKTLRAKSNDLGEFFDTIVEIDDGPTTGTMASKILALEYSPYKKVLVLDNDTLPVGDVSCGFSFVNENRRIALAIAPRQEIKHNGFLITNFQNGVMFVLRTSETLGLFESWYNEVCKNDPSGPTRFILSKLLYEYDSIGVYPLSYKWNFRVDLLRDYDVKPKALRRILPEVHIFHSHLERKVAWKVIKQVPGIVKIRKIGGF